jgi:hypothetical protein
MPSQPDYSLMSFCLGVGGCGAMVPTGPHGRPNSCRLPVTRCGLVLRERPAGRPAEAWLVFACEAHAGDLIAARELLDRDRVVLGQWRAETARAEAGHPWQRPEPLARGADAVQLVERAQRWAERQASTGAS